MWDLPFCQAASSSKSRTHSVAEKSLMYDKVVQKAPVRIKTKKGKESLVLKRLLTSFRISSGGSLGHWSYGFWEKKDVIRDVR